MPGDPLDPPPGGGSDPLDGGSISGGASASWVSSAEVLTRSLVSNGQGGFTEIVSISATYDCNLAKASRFAYSESEGRVVGTSVWTCQLPLESASTVRSGVRLRIDGGSEWDVIETDEGASGALFLSASVERTGR